MPSKVSLHHAERPGAFQLNDWDCAVRHLYLIHSSTHLVWPPAGRSGYLREQPSAVEEAQASAPANRPNSDRYEFSRRERTWCAVLCTVWLLRFGLGVSAGVMGQR